MRSGAGFGAPGIGGGINRNPPARSGKKAGGLATLFLLAATALAGSYAYQHTRINLGLQQTTATSPTPAQIADTFLDKIVPEEAIRHGKAYRLDSSGQLKIDPGRKDFIRSLIIKYESFDIKPEDAELFFDGSLEPADLDYLRERIAYNKTVTDDPALAATSAVRDLETRANIGEHNDPGFPHYPDQIEQRIRNLKFNRQYGEMSEQQAQTMAARYPGTSVENARRYLTMIDYTTDSKAALDSGLRGYFFAREFTIATARNANRPASKPLIEFIP